MISHSLFEWYIKKKKSVELNLQCSKPSFGKWSHHHHEKKNKMRWLKFRSIQIRWEKEGLLCFLALVQPPFIISNSILLLSDHAGTHYLTSKWIHCGKTPQMQMNRKDVLILKLKELFPFPPLPVDGEVMDILNQLKLCQDKPFVSLFQHYIEETIYMTVIRLLYLVVCSLPISGNLPLYKTLNRLFKARKVCVILFKTWQLESSAIWVDFVHLLALGEDQKRNNSSKVPFYTMCTIRKKVTMSFICFFFSPQANDYFHFFIYCVELSYQSFFFF